MRPHEDDEPNVYRGSQPGESNPEQRPPAGNEQRSPPGRQQPQQGGEPQGPPPGAGTGQPPQSRNPPQGTGSPPPQGGPPQQWHQPPSPPAQQSGSQQRSPPPGPQSQPPQGQHAGGAGSQQPGGGRRARPERTGLQPVSVDDIVETDVVTAERDTPLTDVVERMADEGVGSVVIVDDDSPIGVLTDRTIALSLAETPDASDREAGDLVSGDLVTGSTDMSVFDALQQLGDAGIRRLPIVDEDGSLEGIVTLDDVLVLLGTELGNAVEVIKDQSPRI